MCYRPINIINPSFKSLDGSGFTSYVEGFSKKSLNVGCGFCPQCQSLRQSEWQLRLRYEWKACKESGGFCFKEELTYRPEDVPTYNGIMCFDKTHVQKFLKRLRRHIDTFCKNNNFEPIKLHYFCVCEYGGNGTHRPHYHILLFVYSNRIPVKFFNRLVARSWFYGLTNNNTGRTRKAIWSVDSKVVQSFSGIEYVTKYLFKDKAFIRNLLQQENAGFLVDYIKDKIDFDLKAFLDTEDVAEYASFYIVWKLLYKSPYKHLLPFSLKSQGLGIFLLQHLSYDDFVAGVFNDVTISKLQYIPRYYMRKVFYDYVSLLRTYVPKKEFFDMQYNSFVKNLRNTFYDAVLRDMPSDVIKDVTSQLSWFGFDLGCESYYKYCVYTFMSSISGKKYINPLLYNEQSVFDVVVKSIYERGYIHSLYNRITFNSNKIFDVIDELMDIPDIDFIDKSVLDYIDLYTSDEPFYKGQNFTIDDLFRRIDTILQSAKNYQNTCKCNDMLHRIKLNNLSINKQTND